MASGFAVRDHQRGAGVEPGWEISATGAGHEVVLAHDHQVGALDQPTQTRCASLNHRARLENPQESLPAERDERGISRNRSPRVRELVGDRDEEDRFRSVAPSPRQRGDRHGIRRGEAELRPSFG